MSAPLPTDNPSLSWAEVLESMISFLALVAGGKFIGKFATPKDDVLVPIQSPNKHPEGLHSDQKCDRVNDQYVKSNCQRPPLHF
jgi:hypothetical protein